MTYEGYVHNGVVLENGATLPEGTKVRVDADESGVVKGDPSETLGASDTTVFRGRQGSPR